VPGIRLGQDRVGGPGKMGVPACGQDQDVRGRGVTAQAPDELHAVHDRHHDVGHHQIRWRLSYGLQRSGTIADIGLRFRPFHRFAERDGAFHLLGIHASPLGFVAELPRIQRCRPMRAGKAYDALSARAALSSASGRIEYMIDGDLHVAETTRLEIAIGPKVHLLVDRHTREPTGQIRPASLASAGSSP